MASKLGFVSSHRGDGTNADNKTLASSSTSGEPQTVSMVRASSAPPSKSAIEQTSSAPPLKPSKGIGPLAQLFEERDQEAKAEAATKTVTAPADPPGQQPV